MGTIECELCSVECRYSVKTKIQFTNFQIKTEESMTIACKYVVRCTDLFLRFTHDMILLVDYMNWTTTICITNVKAIKNRFNEIIYSLISQGTGSAKTLKMHYAFMYWALYILMDWLWSVWDAKCDKTTTESRINYLMASKWMENLQHALHVCVYGLCACLYYVHVLHFNTFFWTKNYHRVLILLCNRNGKKEENNRTEKHMKKVHSKPEKLCTHHEEFGIVNSWL